MGFSLQNKQHASNPSGNTCTRKVSSVFSSIASFNSSMNLNSSLLSHLRSWQRSRRLKALNKNSNSLVEQLTPMNNLCYQSMSQSANFHMQQSSPPTAEANYYKTGNSFLSFNDANLTSAPVVSFMNKGEGMIALQLANRVMQNENQLYSMNLTSLKNDDNFNSSMDKSNTGCYSTIEPPTGEDNQLKNSLHNEAWYYGLISREKSMQIIKNCPTGSFVVRNSATKENCYALTVRVPRDYNFAGVAHYLILQTEDCKYRIKGFQKEFDSIPSLVIHHSIMKEQLPCTLRLNTGNIHKSVSCSHISYNTTTNHRANKINKNETLYSLSSSQISNKKQQSVNNIYNTYGKSSYQVNPTLSCSNEDLMVDIDLDPTYQKILDTFRKAMAHCS